MVGRDLGPYHVVEKIGEGGMGEVYRATDTSLKRPVAIKVLPASFATDADRLARFQREAEVLASLNHPNIAQVYGLERTPGTTALVMELVEGSTIAERIVEGPLPMEEAIGLARQIAHALEAAHERGIVHRDLKPANVKVRPDGTVKVLDFGLAKAVAPDPARAAAGGAPHASLSPTITTPAVTQAGVILGTAAYMSPEQARGKPVDQRTDVWAFGAVLFEMLTGRRAFTGSDVSDTLAGILRDEPDWTALPADLSPTVRAFLRRCLQKDVTQRVHHIADVRLALEGAFEIEAAAGRIQPAGRQVARRWIAAAAAGIVLVAAAALAWLGSGSTDMPPQPVRRFPIALPPSDELAGGVGSLLALSPDGQTLVYHASVNDVFRLYRRSLDQLDATAIPGTDDAGSHPFFSPDGRWIGFHSGTELWKVAVAGGRPVRLATLPMGEPRGASWAADDTIVVAARRGGLVRVPADGGDPVVLAAPDDDREYWYPQVLPGGRGVLYTASFPEVDAGDLFVLEPETGRRRLVLRDAVAGHYLPTGHLAFVRGGDGWAVGFDLDRLEAVGEAVVVEQGIRVEDGGAVQMAIGGDGSIAYVPADVDAAPNRRALVWVDREGRQESIDAGSHVFESPRLSPDGRRVAVAIRDASADIWVHDLARGSMSRLTADTGEDEAPLWSPDGQQIAYAASRGGTRRTMRRAADGSGGETPISAEVNHHHLSAWSPDGQTIVFESRLAGSASWDVWVSPLGEAAAPRAFLQTGVVERGAVFSPDGLWLAYESRETGRSEIYVQAFPGGGRKQQISIEGGTEPVWSSSGGELFYRQGDRMMAVDIRLTPALTASRPRVLFEGRYVRLPWGARNYDVSRDATRFLMLQAEGRDEPQRIVLVQHWVDEVRRRAPHP